MVPDDFMENCIKLRKELLPLLDKNSSVFLTTVMKLWTDLIASSDDWEEEEKKAIACFKANIKLSRMEFIEFMKENKKDKKKDGQR